MANWLLWPRSRSPVVATWPKPTRVYFTGTSSTSRGEQSGFDANKTQTKKTTCNTSQLSKSIRSKESKGSNLRYLNSGRMSRHSGGHHNERLECAEPILFVWVWYLVGKASKSVGLIIIIVIVPTDHSFMPIVVGNPCHHFQTHPRESEAVQISFQHIRWFL